MRVAILSRVKRTLHSENGEFSNYLKGYNLIVPRLVLAFRIGPCAPDIYLLRITPKRVSWTPVSPASVPRIKSNTSESRNAPKARPEDSKRPTAGLSNQSWRREVRLSWFLASNNLILGQTRRPWISRRIAANTEMVLHKSQATGRAPQSTGVPCSNSDPCPESSVLDPSWHHKPRSTASSICTGNVVRR